MKTKVSISQDPCEKTPPRRNPTNDYIKNQKRRHIEVKSSQVLDKAVTTPVCQPFFRSRKASFQTSSGSSKGSLRTPLSSSNKDSRHVRLLSNSSSGYQSLSRSHSIIKKCSKSKAPIIRRLNISGVFLSTYQGPRVAKYRFSQSNNMQNFLPPRALAQRSNISSSFELWRCMVEKENIYHCDPNYFNRQSYINPEMRSILLEWMKEVCDAYNLDSETLYLAIDYLDRYLSAVSDVPTCSLQAIGTSCLYVAAKLHEITTPPIESFAHVTDGACSANDILIHESHLLLKINWLLQPVTPLSWLRLFLQLYHTQDRRYQDSPSNDEYQGPLTRMRYVQAFDRSYYSKDFLMNDEQHANPLYESTLNSCIRDVGSLRYSYAVIAATILHLTMDIDVFNITGFGSDEIGSCAKWLRQFVPSSSLQISTESSMLTDRTNCRLSDYDCDKFSQISLNVSDEKENIPTHA